MAGRPQWLFGQNLSKNKFVCTHVEDPWRVVVLTYNSYVLFSNQRYERALERQYSLFIGAEISKL